MTLAEFQALVDGNTRTYTGGLLYAVIGLAGETGELCEEVKKSLSEGEPLTSARRDNFALELGDVLHYVARCASSAGMSLEEVARRHSVKLSEKWGRA